MISPLSFVHEKAILGVNVVVEPFAYIDEDVEIGDGSWIGPHSSIMKGTSLGMNCKVFPGAVIGAIPQDLKFRNEVTTVEIGDNVVIRECCTINRGTEASMTTKIGKNTLLMAYVHIAHDCIVGDNCVLANNVNLAGHVEIGDYAILGGLVAVHQFVRIGAHVMISGGALLSKDVPPFVKAARNPLSYAGVNSIGLKRRGYTSEQINHIQDIYRILFVKRDNVKKSVEEIKSIISDSEEKDTIINFISQSDRGLMKGFKGLN